ncbi:hypothetical protein HMPREF9419_0837 [Prevotella nigrescens ATCC 33563]|nr:hypothetical protein HMPREF9419_0837 [Prevotella nigrescens ATCC 33563]
MLNNLVINIFLNPLFCFSKQWVLHGKGGCFVLQNNRFRNIKVQLLLFKRIIFTKPKIFSVLASDNKKENHSLNKLLPNRHHDF